MRAKVGIGQVNLQQGPREQRREEDGGERVGHVQRAVVLAAGEAQEALHEGDVAQRRERVHHLEHEDLGDQIVLIHRVLVR